MDNDKNLHNMSLEKLGQLFPIIITEHSDRWIECYHTESQSITDSFSKSDIISIDHIGSTAIPDIKAKPTIDILLQVSDHIDTRKIVETFISLGYHYTKQPENPPPHMMFVKGYTINGFKGQAYHVHVRYKGDWDEICFRNYLKEHKELAREYEILKLELAERYKNDRDAYTRAKSGFIKKVNELARSSRTPDSGKI
jgi:GrpB-like predicted nucleotidyltransferase (UPF0157 family)